MIQFIPILKAGWGFIKPFWPWLAAAAGLLVGGWYVHHRGYDAGYEAAETAWEAAAQKAGESFARELEARDKAIAEAQGQTTEVIRWKTRTITKFEEAVEHDPDCKAWADAAIRCPLGLPDGTADHQGLPADPG